MTISRFLSLIACCLLFVKLPVAAQTATTQSRPAAEQAARALECPDPAAKVACHSFQELLAAKDEDLMYTLRRRLQDGNGQVFVCFRPREDVFFLLWYGEPEDQEWTKETGTFTAPGTAELLQFKNGIFEHGGESAWASGKWRSVDRKSSDAKFESEELASEGGSRGEIDVDGGTVTVSHSLEKVAGSAAQYSFRLQKSTGRFTETFTTPNTPESQITGRCVKWNPNPH